MVDLLRHGGMGRLFDGIRAPSTCTFLRAFTSGDVRQLDAVAAGPLARLATATPVLPDAREVVLVDIDDTVGQTYGYAKQGAGRGYTGCKGLNALLATVSTPISAPHAPPTIDRDSSSPGRALARSGRVGLQRRARHAEPHGGCSSPARRTSTPLPEFVDGRDAGTPRCCPPIAWGRTVRLRTRPAVGGPPGRTPWARPGGRPPARLRPDRLVVPAAHLHRPDWLREPRRRRGQPVRWFPFVTFWQVTADIPFFTGVQEGHGHVYTRDTSTHGPECCSHPAGPTTGRPGHARSSHQAVETPPWGVSASWVRQPGRYQAAPILDGRHSCMPTARTCSAWASLHLLDGRRHLAVVHPIRATCPPRTPVTIVAHRPLDDRLDEGARW